MKMIEEVKGLRKEFVHDVYTRIITNFKNYDKITKTKMIEEIYKVYSDYNNIIDICTERELNYLKLVLNKDKKYLDKKYEWEKRTLYSKFLVRINHKTDEREIPEEIYDNVKEAVSKANLSDVKKKDEINIFAVTYVKIQGSCPMLNIIQIGSPILGITEEELLDHIENNRVFKYYVYVYDKYIEEIDKNITMAIHNDYYHLVDELERERSIQGKRAQVGAIDYEKYKTLFYNNFDINNKIIKKFLEELDKLPFLSFTAIRPIREYALLNRDRSTLKKSIAEVPANKNCDLTDFFNLMDKAMDEMPSGVLNGLTPNELKEVKKEELEYEVKKERKYVKQQNACLSKKEADLFYKIYFGLLDFTNQKFKIKPGYKIYNKTGINPQDISEIVDKFWKTKDGVVLEFCLANPYKFNSEEIKMTQNFRKGFRDMFIIVEYQKDYTAMMCNDKAYMIKGINSNIDEVIPYKDLPYVVLTSIIPFGDKLIYDGLFMSYNISFGMGFKKTVERDYEGMMKYYHL